jgi:two-component system, OmpR family, sensor histidine kinase ChvG
MRLRMYDAEGKLWADSFVLPSPAFRFNDPSADASGNKLCALARPTVNFIVGRARQDYVEPKRRTPTPGPNWLRAREQGRTQIELRTAPDGHPVITAAAPVG